MQVTLVFPESRVMERLFTPEIASFYEKFYEDKCAHIACKCEWAGCCCVAWTPDLTDTRCARNRGIKFRKGTTVTAFEGEDGKVRVLRC